MLVKVTSRRWMYDGGGAFRHLEAHEIYEMGGAAKVMGGLTGHGTVAGVWASLACLVEWHYWDVSAAQLRDRLPRSCAHFVAISRLLFR